MIVKKFTANTTRDALQQVRDALGPEALILSNRVQDGNVEIMAMADTDVASLTQSAVASTGPAAATLRHDIPGIKILESATPIKPVQTIEPAPKPIPATDHNVTPEANVAVESLALEVKNIRSLIERQLVNLVWRDMKSADPLKFDVLRTLLDVGFSPRLARQLSNALPNDLDEEKALRWVRGAIAHNLRGTPGAALIEQGGVFALVGPTGVGKTTTVAKLAARCVLKRGPDSLALITTDTYRIGAHEQLKIYGKILNVPVYAVKDEIELARTLDELRHKHLVLIDTAGMSQRDRRINAQIALLSSSGKARPIQRLLLLSATAQAGTLDDVVRAYIGTGLAGVVLTKLDEALSIAPVLDVVVRQKLAVHYITNGQRVPEDIHRANHLYLVDRAFKCEADATHTAQEDEYLLKISAREDDAHAFVNAAQSA